MIQKTTGDINHGTADKGTLDLRTPEGEAKKAAAAEAKADRLAEQANSVSVSAPGVDGFTPAPASPPMPQLGAESTQAPDESKTPTFALTPEPPKPAEELAPKAITTQAPLGSGPTDTAAAPQTAPVAEQPTKKPGFFGKLFGKK